MKSPSPAHQAIINAIGDTETSAAALAVARDLVALSTAPVVNSPDAVLATSRSNNAERLSRLPGVIAPLTATLPRERLSDLDAADTLARHGFEFPLLLRAAGLSHGIAFSAGRQ